MTVCVADVDGPREDFSSYRMAYIHNCRSWSKSSETVNASSHEIFCVC